jgi:hypothetical protein
MSELKPCPFCGTLPQANAWIFRGISETRYFCPNQECPLSVRTVTLEEWNTRPIEDALNARIAELEAARRWIPVGERLPEEKQSVLALDRTGTAYHWEYSKCLSNIFVGYYTHWMPLPEPPEVKE